MESDTGADVPGNGQQRSVLQLSQQPKYREPPSFITLPTEILLEIHSYLSSDPAGFIFPLVCKRLFHTFPIPRWEFRKDDPEQAALLCLLEEKCGFFHPEYRVCYGGCRFGQRIAVHPRSDFHPLELAYHSFRGPRTRACFLFAKSLWVSPSKQSSPAQFLRQSRSILNPPDPPPPGEGETVIGCHGSYSFTLQSLHEIITVPEQACVMYEDIALILSGFGLYVCPHMKLNNRRVVELFDPERQSIDGPALLDRMDAVNCDFPACNTEVYWVSQRSATHTGANQANSSGHQTTATSGPSRQKTIYLYTNRVLGTRVTGCDTPSFLSQLIIPNTARLTAYWNKCLEWKALIAPPIAEKYENGQPAPSSSTGMKRFLPGAPDLAPEPGGDPLFWPLYTYEPENAPIQVLDVLKKYWGLRQFDRDEPLDLEAWISGKKSSCPSQPDTFTPPWGSRYYYV